MTVSVSNTNLNDSFNSWRLNTNFAATVISNNVVTVSRAGSANRGGAVVGNGHVSGTFSANELRADYIRSGNTTSKSNWVIIASNTFINATAVSVTANTTFQGNVNFLTSGSDRVILGDISRIRVTGGSLGQFVRISGSTDTPEFKTLSLRDIADLSSNASNIILSGANTAFSDNNDSPALVLSNGTDRAFLFMASDAIIGDSDVHLKLVDASGDSRFVITDNSNNIVGHIASDGTAVLTANLTAVGITTSDNILPDADDSVDLGSPNREFRNLYIDGVANVDELSLGTSAGQGVSTSLIPKTDAVGNLGSTTRKWGTVWADTTNGGAGVFNTLGVSGAFTANGTATFNGGFSLNGDVDIGDASTDTLTITAQVDSNIDPESETQRGLGTNSNRWHEVYANNVVANNITIDNNLSIDGDLTVQGNTTFASGAVSAPDGTFTSITVTGSATLNGGIDLGNQTTDLITATGQFDSALIPATDDTYDLGTATKQWQDLYIDGTASIDTLSVDENADIAGTLAVGNTDIDGFLDVSNEIKNDGTVIVGSNGKLHANNTITAKTITATMLANTMNIATFRTHGSASQVPIISVNAKGQVIGISNTSVAGVTSLTYTDANNTFSIGTADGGTFSANIAVSESTTDSTDATRKGVSSFNSNQFEVANGHVSLAGGADGAITRVTGTANEIEINRVGANATFGLPDDVTISGQLDVGENVVISGNLIVNGTTTTINAETVNLADNKIVLNSDYGGSTPTSDAGIVVERGTKGNYEFIWDESEGRWTSGTRDIAGNNFVGNASTANTLANTVQFSITGDVVMGDGVSNPTFDGSNGVQLDVRIANTSPSIIRVFDINDTQVFP